TADLASTLAKLGRPHALESEIAVDAARFPVARITAVDERDAVKVARRPDRSAQSGRAAAHDADVERPLRSLRHATGESQERFRHRPRSPRRLQTSITAARPAEAGREAAV